MKKLTLATVVVASLAATFLSCSKSLYQSEYRTGMIADGRINDWQHNVEADSKKGRFHYAVSNDKEQVMVVFRTFDRLTQAKVLLNGMKLYLDPKLNESRTTFIQFPFPQKNIDSLVNKIQLRPGVKPPAEKLKGFIATLQHLRLSGFNEGYNGTYSLDSSQVKVAISFDDDDALIYEAIIPFKAFSENGVMPKSLGFFVQVDGLQPVAQPIDYLSGVPHKPSQGGYYAGGSGGPGNPGQPDGVQLMKENIKFELNVKLASK